MPGRISRIAKATKSFVTTEAFPPRVGARVIVLYRMRPRRGRITRIIGAKTGSIERRRADVTLDTPVGGVRKINVSVMSILSL